MRIGIFDSGYGGPTILEGDTQASPAIRLSISWRQRARALWVALIRHCVCLHASGRGKIVSRGMQTRDLGLQHGLRKGTAFDSAKRPSGNRPFEEGARRNPASPWKLYRRFPNRGISDFSPPPKTVASHSYAMELEKTAPEINITELACPMVSILWRIMKPTHREPTIS